jgi:hypothetical protein
MGIGPGLAIARHGLAQGGQIIGVDQVGRVVPLGVQGAGFRAGPENVVRAGAIGDGYRAGFFVAGYGDGFQHGGLAFSLSGGVAQRDAWRNFKPSKNQLSTPRRKKKLSAVQDFLQQQE